MPYCRKCGTKLDDNAKYCYRCGTPVTPTAPPTMPISHSPAQIRSEPTSIKKNPFFIPIITIIIVAVTALVIALIFSAPLVPVNFTDSSQINQPNVNHLNLDFHADIAEVNVFTNLTSQTVVMEVSATGATNIFLADEPVRFTVENSTVNGGEMVTAKIITDVAPFSGNLRVVCNIYVNPDLDLTLNVRSNVGEVKMNANSEAKISSLNLKTTTGSTQLFIHKETVVSGDLTLETATGDIHFSMEQANVDGNITIGLSSGTGSVNMNIAETQRLDGNIQINAYTRTGDVNLNRLLIDGEVAARIESNKGIGGITTDLHNFSGNQSPVESNNYPSSSNINVNLSTGIGSIHIVATYSTSAVPTLRN